MTESSSISELVAAERDGSTYILVMQLVIIVYHAQ